MFREAGGREEDYMIFLSRYYCYYTLLSQSPQNHGGGPVGDHTVFSG